jgi:predicted permease
VVYVSRLRLTESLSEDTAAAIGLHKRSRTFAARVSICGLQVAAACVLLIGASLLSRTFVALVTIDRGYTPSGILTAKLSLPQPVYTPERRYSIADDILSRLESAPGIIDAAFTSEMPLTAGGSTAASTFKSPGGDAGVITVQASPRIVSPRYFSAMGMRIHDGRSFSGTDTQTSLPVAIVNRTFARKYLGNTAVGSMLPMGMGYQNVMEPYATVIGVVEDIRYVSPAEPAQPEIYYSYLQLRHRIPISTLNLVVHTTGNPADFVSTLRWSLRQADTTLVPDSIFTMNELLSQGLTRPRLYAVLLGGFALLAVFISGVGLFAVLSYSVAQQARDIAVRTALGAARLHIIRRVLGQGVSIAAAGLAAGLLSSAILARWLTTLLYGITPHDTLTYIAVALFILTTAAAACIAPAIRASRIDPVDLLKGT